MSLISARAMATICRSAVERGTDRGLKIDRHVEPGQGLGAELAATLGIDEGLAFA